MNESYLNDAAGSSATLRIPGTAPDWAHHLLATLVEFTSDLPPVGELPDALDALTELAEFDAHSAFASPLLGELFARVRTAALPAIKTTICAGVEADEQAARDAQSRAAGVHEALQQEITRLKIKAGEASGPAAGSDAPAQSTTAAGGLLTALTHPAEAAQDAVAAGVLPETAGGGIAQGVPYPAEHFIGKRWRLRDQRVVLITHAKDGVLYAEDSGSFSLPQGLRWPLGTLKGFAVTNGVLGHDSAWDLMHEAP